MRKTTHRINTIVSNSGSGAADSKWGLLLQSKWQISYEAWLIRRNVNASKKDCGNGDLEQPTRNSEGTVKFRILQQNDGF
jgi:hypothetical protein